MVSGQVKVRGAWCPISEIKGRAVSSCQRVREGALRACGRDLF